MPTRRIRFGPVDKPRAIQIPGKVESFGSFPEQREVALLERARRALSWLADGGVGGRARMYSSPNYTGRRSEFIFLGGRLVPDKS